MKNLYIRNNIFYYRKSIPKNLKIFFQNKNLYIRTLGTKSKTLALKYVRLLNQKFNAIKEVYFMSLDITLIHQLVDEFHNTQLELAEKDLFNTPNPWDTMLGFCLEEDISIFQKNYHNNVFDDDEIQIILSKLNYTPNKDEIKEIGKILLDTKINNLKTINERINKGYYGKSKPINSINANNTNTNHININNIIHTNINNSNTTLNNTNIDNSNTTPNTTTNNNTNTNPTATPNNKNNTTDENTKKDTVESTFEEFIKVQNKIDKWSKDTEQLVRRAINILLLYFKDKELTTMKFTDLIDFRDILLEIPKRLSVLNFFKGQDLDFILDNNDDYDKLDNSTINKYILRINQYFNYMYKQKYIKIKDFNIPSYDQDGNEREPYTDEEIHKIKELIKIDTLDNQFITYIAIYQGMRLKEITQLKKEDIIKIGDILCISVNTNENKTVKTKQSARIIPIHDKLIELGFLDFVNSKENKLFDISNKNFSTYFRKTYKSQINDEKTFYCLRHSFIDALKQNDCKLEHYQAFVGHSSGKDKITMNYGNPLNTQLLKKLLYFIKY